MTKAKYTNEELIGKKFGKLTLIEKIYEKRYPSDIKRWWWVCKCDCGRTVKRLQCNVYQGKTKSCDCTRPERDYKPVNYQGYGELSGAYYNALKNKCRKYDLNREFNVTIEYLWNLFLEQNRKCALSGIELKFGRQQRKNKANNIQTASLDRIDSDKGYIIGNVQWVHKDINYMKNYYDQDYYINMCKLVAKTQESLLRTSNGQPHDTTVAMRSHLEGQYL